MSDSERESQREGSWLPVYAAIVTLLLLVAYPLSLGPALWLHRHGYIPTSAGVIYAPLGFLAAIWEPAGHLLDWYKELWR